jgi:dolichyl-phosphate beta-glucosyltransferase
MPALNEERRLPRLFETLGSTAGDALGAAGLELSQVLIADDGSSDRTAELIADAAARDPRIVRLPREPGGRAGKGAALRRGILAAEAELVLLSDIDLATPLSEAAKLNDRLRRGADLAIASRDLPGSALENAERHRTFIGRVFNGAVRGLTGLPFRDTQCGFKLLPTAVAKELASEQLISGYAWDIELLLRARNAGLRTEEVPVRWIHDHDSRVRMASAAFQMAADLLRLTRALGGRSRGRPGASRRGG